MAAPKRVDWLAAEGDYRSGRLSIQAIADKLGVVESAVRLAAKKRGWLRDPSGVKAERVKAALAGAAKAAQAAVRAGQAADEAADQAVGEEADRDIRVLSKATAFYEQMIEKGCEALAALMDPRDQKITTETVTIAATMYRKLRGLEDKPAGKSIEDLLREL